MTVEEKVAAIGVQIGEHERRLNGIEGEEEVHRNRLEKMGLQMAGMVQEVKSIKEEIMRANRRNMWTVGIVIALTNLAVDVLILVLH